MRILKGFKSFVLEVFIVKGLRVRFMEVRILKGLRGEAGEGERVRSRGWRELLTRVARIT